MQQEEQRALFFSKRKQLLSQWHKGEGLLPESQNQLIHWQALARNQIPEIDVLTFLDRLKKKTSQNGILDECILFAEEQKLENPLLYAPTLAGFKKRKEFIITLMEQLFINPSTEEKN